MDKEPMSKREVELWFIIGVLLFLFFAFAMIMLLPKDVNDDSWTAEPDYENSLYVGHFAPNVELRRIDDIEMGITCYRMYNALSCVPTPTQEPTE